jgi:hypothetical protein
MTLPGVIAATLVALAVNFALTFWLAHRALRPLVERLLAHTQFRVPQVSPENELTVAVLMRGHGPPLFLQATSRALRRAGPHVHDVSKACSRDGSGVIVFGKALVEGKAAWRSGRDVARGGPGLVHVLRKVSQRDAGQA